MEDGGEGKREGLEEAIGYHFRNPYLLDLALIHRSNGRPNNERLEFLGDAVLSFVVSEFLFADEDDDEEALTKKRSRLTDRVALELVAERINLSKYLVSGKSLRGKISGKMLSDGVEALIGAVFQDGEDGIAEASAVVHHLLLNNDVMEAVLGRVDWITRLKEWCDKEKVVQPRYYVLEERVEGEKSLFQVWLTVRNASGSGSGETKKEAMMMASEKVMRQLEAEAS
ncbi:MAG: ribonuclease III [Methanomassiliicoccales archaeon PtaU1.Bin124]|nr:MAG: ribonuclease III [Methanomassiliicoccales archaeon PtaU1.Bin124]